MDIKYAIIGFLRGLGFVLLSAGLTYVGNVDNLSFLAAPWPLVISGLVLAIEHAIEAKTGRALFGAVKA